MDPMLRTPLLAALIVLSLLDAPASAIGPDPVLLWPDGAPGAMGNEDADKPAIRIYQPDPAIATGTMIVVCPGGGYGGLAVDHEGHQVAEWLKSQGVASAVLRYRLGPKYHHPAPLNDVSRAIRYVRAHADELKIAANRVGVMGFSAGGHLASTVSTHFGAGKPGDDDLMERQDSRPDFAVLCYPVISFTADFAHKGSARNLLGENPDPELLKSLSNDTQVTDKTPPTFIFHTQEDTGVPVGNALAYYAALVAHKVPAELHIYQNGPHGVGLAIGDPVVTTWKERLIDWMQTNGFLAGVERAPVKGKVSLGGKPLSWGTITLIPKAPSRAPVSSGLVSGGNFSSPAARGAVVGENSVVIKTMGSFAPHPTIENSATVSDGNIVFDVKQTGENEFLLELK
jgi:acetyl esterase/lipase